MEKESKQDTTSVPNNGTASAEQWLAVCRPCTELFSEAWRDAADDVLCSLIEGVWEGRSTFTLAALSLTLDFRTGGPDISESDRSNLISSVAIGIMLSVLDEFLRRQALAETEAGRLARKFAVQPNDFTKQDMKDLARSAQFKTRYNPDGLGGKAEHRFQSSEENASIIFEHCARVLSEETIPTANTKDGLQRLMCGWFNPIPRKADNFLVEEIKRSKVRARRTVHVEDGTEDGGGAPDTLTDFPVEGGETLDNRNGWRLDVRSQEPEPDRILLAEILAGDILAPRERKVMELLLEGRTEAEIGAELTVSQPRISQLKKRIEHKIQARKNIKPLQTRSKPRS